MSDCDLGYEELLARLRALKQENAELLRELKKGRESGELIPEEDVVGHFDRNH